VNGESNNKIIIQTFSEYFSEVCCPNSIDSHNQLKSEFQQKFSNYNGTPLGEFDPITVKLLDIITSSMKIGKAAGVDGIMIEYIKYCHLIIMVMLKSYLTLCTYLDT
jgi:hypothetical protein